MIFNTDICEPACSKRVFAGVLAGLKERLAEPVIKVAGKTLSSHRFTGVMNMDGCLFLAGVGVKGDSLLDSCHPDFPRRNSVAETGDFLSLLRLLAAAAFVYKDFTGFFPRLLVNGCYVDRRDGSVLFFPQPLSEFLCTHLAEERKKVVYFVSGGARREKIGNDAEFALSMARLTYLFFTGGRDLNGSPVYYLGECAPGMPKQMSDFVWAAMRGRKADLNALCGLLESVDGGHHPPAKVSFGKRHGFLEFKRSLGRFFVSRIKLLIGGIVLCGIVVYIITDLVQKGRSRDYNAGMGPRQVVEFYYTAMDRLDVEAVESLFYKKSGRGVVRELSTMYVMSRFDELYGRRPGNVGVASPGASEVSGAGAVDSEGPSPGGSAFLEIDDLKLEPYEDGGKPAFRARYKKVVNSSEKKAEYRIDEVLFLVSINGRWYIAKISQNVEP